MSRWFRVYDDLIDDPKVQRLSPELFKSLINIWCLSSRNSGVLPPLDDVAFSLRVRPERAYKILGELRNSGLLDDDETGCRPHNWASRQFKSDGSTERVKRFRNAQRNVDETFHRPLQQQDQSTETETETEQRQKDISVAARPHPASRDGWPEDHAEQFWRQYPIKVGKKAALKSLALVRRRGEVSFLDLMAALMRYAAKTDDRPFCHPTTWINQGRWTDEPASNANGHLQKTHPLIAAADELVKQAERRHAEYLAGYGGDEDGPIIDGTISEG